MNRVSKEAFRVWPALPTKGRHGGLARNKGRRDEDDSRGTVSGATRDAFYRFRKFTASDRHGQTRDAPIFLFRRDESRLYGSLSRLASPADPKGGRAVWRGINADAYTRASHPYVGTRSGTVLIPSAAGLFALAHAVSASDLRCQRKACPTLAATGCSNTSSTAIPLRSSVC